MRATIQTPGGLCLSSTLELDESESTLYLHRALMLLFLLLFFCCVLYTVTRGSLLNRRDNLRVLRVACRFSLLRKQNTFLFFYEFDSIATGIDLLRGGEPSRHALLALRNQRPIQAILRPGKKISYAGNRTHNGLPAELLGVVWQFFCLPPEGSGGRRVPEIPSLARAITGVPVAAAEGRPPVDAGCLLVTVLAMNRLTADAW